MTKERPSRRPLAAILIVLLVWAIASQLGLVKFADVQQLVVHPTPSQT